MSNLASHPQCLPRPSPLPNPTGSALLDARLSVNESPTCFDPERMAKGFPEHLQIQDQKHLVVPQNHAPERMTECPASRLSRAEPNRPHFGVHHNCSSHHPSGHPTSLFQSDITIDVQRNKAAGGRRLGGFEESLESGHTPPNCPVFALGPAVRPDDRDQVRRKQLSGIGEIKRVLMVSERDPYAFDHVAAEATPSLKENNSSVPRKLSDAEGQLLEQIQDHYCEQGADLEVRVTDALDKHHLALSQRLAYISDLDRSFLGRFSDLSANFDQPLSRSWTYDNDAKERQIFIEEEVAVVRREVADLERFLEGKWREWDDCKSAEAEAFAQIIQGLEETRRDEELGQDMAALRKEIKKAEKEAIEEMRDYNKEFEREKAKMDAAAHSHLWD